jgi:hypothetical protein
MGRIDAGGSRKSKGGGAKKKKKATKKAIKARQEKPEDFPEVRSGWGDRCSQSCVY